MYSPNTFLPPGNGAYADPWTKDLEVRGLYDPLALQYFPLKRFQGTVDFFGRSLSPFVNPLQTFAGGQVNPLAGDDLLSTTSLNEDSFIHVSVWAYEILNGLRVDQPSVQGITSSGSRGASALKVQIGWAQRPLGRREIIADLGSGIDTHIGPTSQVWIDLMVPDLLTAPPQRPATFSSFAQYNTRVVASCRIARSIGSQDNLTYTQTVYAIGGDTPQRPLVPVVPEARSVQVFSNLGCDDSAASIQFLYDTPEQLSPPPENAGLDLAPVFATANLPCLTTGGPSIRMLIPQTAKFIRGSSNAPNGELLTIVQELVR